MRDMQVFQDCEVVIQLISSDIDVEGRVDMLCLYSCQGYIAVPLTPAAVSCDVWLSNGLVSHREDGQTQIITSHLHSGGSLTHLAHVPAGR